MRQPHFFFTCLALVGLLGLSSTAAAGVCTIGHAHAGVIYDGTQLTLDFQSEGATIDGVVYNAPVPGYLFPASDIVILVPATTWQKSTSTQSAYLGVPAGGDYFRLSDQSLDCSKEKTSYFGFGTEGIDYGTFANDIVNFALTGVVAAPPGGQFSVYAPGPQRWMDTADGSFANDVLPMPVYTHGHYDFGFSKAGIYKIQFTASAQKPAGGTVSDTAVFTFDVPGSATWTKLGQGGTWGDVGNWNGSAGGAGAYDSWVPDSYYDWATLAKATGPATAVTLNGSRTLGRLTLGKDPTAATTTDAGYKLLAGSGGSLTLDRGHSTVQPKTTLVESLSGQHEIAVGVTLADNTEMNVAAASGLLISGAITGTKKLIKTGDGVLTLSGPDGYTGGTEIQAGILKIASADALPKGGSLTIQAGGTSGLSSGVSSIVGSAGASASPSTSASAVPEPGMLALLAAGFAASMAAGCRPGRSAKR